MPASVTMKAGTPTKATQSPCHIPTKAPTTSAASTPTYQGIPCLITTVAATAPVVIKQGMPWYVGVLAALVVGALVGMWQGFWVAVVGIPAFIVTLAGMLLFRGLTYMVLNSISLSPFGGTYYQIANGFQNGLFGGHGVDIFTLVVFGIAVAGYAVNAWRSRRAAMRYEQIVEGIPWFSAKRAVIGGVGK